MSRELPDYHAQALNDTRSIVAAIDESQWSKPSVLDGMTVRELLHHVVYGNFWVGPLMEGKTIEQVGDELEGDILGKDPLQAYDRSSAVAADAFRGPNAMTDLVAVSYGPVPGEVYAGHRFMDVLVHGWDLGRSTGQTVVLDPELAEACRSIIEPQAKMLAAAGAFDEPVPVGEGADEATRLLALTGRKV